MSIRARLFWESQARALGVSVGPKEPTVAEKISRGDRWILQCHAAERWMEGVHKRLIAEGYVWDGFDGYHKDLT